jgi:LuxR family transcriptional regulator
MDRTGRAGLAALLHRLDEKSPAGFAIGLHIEFTAPRYMFQSYAKGWLDQYSAAGLLMFDPTVHWGMNNVGWIRWGDLERIDTHGVLELAKEHGIMNGVTIAIVVDRSRSIASFARADRDYETSEILDLERGFTDLHKATASVEDLTDDDRLALKDLSVRLTH